MDKKILDAVKRFKAALETMGIRVERVVLFGSCASGVSTEHSDIDLAVVSDDFEGMDIFRRLETIGLALARGKITEPIEALGYTVEEYESREQGTLVADEIRAKGVLVL